MQSDGEATRRALEGVVGRLEAGPGVVGGQDDAFELLVGDPHDDVPGHEAAEGGDEAFVEGDGTLAEHHADGAVDGAAVLAARRVHETRLDDVDGRGDDGGAETGADGGGKVARHAVLEPAPRQQVLFEQVVADDLGDVDDGVAADVGQRALPQTLDALGPADGPVRVHGAGVACRRRRRRRRRPRTHLGLHAHLDDVGRLGQQHGQTARRDAGRDAHHHGGVVAAVQRLLVDALDRVVQADADAGEAHLPLQSGHQSVVQTPNNDNNNSHRRQRQKRRRTHPTSGLCLCDYYDWPSNEHNGGLGFFVPRQRPMRSNTSTGRVVEADWTADRPTTATTR